jgi:hypothetical protein
VTNNAKNAAEKLENTARGLGFRLRLRSIKSAKNSFARLLREFAEGNIDEKIFRSLVYGLSGYISILKLQLETQVEDRLREIEKKISEL